MFITTRQEETDCDRVITENEFCSFTIPGKPVGKMRPRAARIGNYTRVYTPKEQVSYESVVKILASQAMRGTDVYQGEISAEIQITVSRPKNVPKNERGKTYAMRRPDVDNVAKSILDACNAIIFKDDVQVVSLSVSRLWGKCDAVNAIFRTVTESDSEDFSKISVNLNQNRTVSDVNVNAKY